MNHPSFPCSQTTSEWIRRCRFSGSRTRPTEQDGRYASAEVVKRAAAKGRAAVKDFILKDIR